MKPKIYIDGEHGTTGLQIIDRLQGRTDVQILSMPHSKRHDVMARKEFLNEADFAILCLPDDAAREAVAMVEDQSTRFIDASTAHRTNPDWVFGFKELTPDHSDKIAQARLVANPGCYSTGAIALIRPLSETGVLPKDIRLSVNAISGYSGGGKNMIAQFEDQSHEDAIAAPHFLYAMGLNHKHVPEIKHYGLLEHAPIFTPSVGRFAQGMIVQLPLHMTTLNAASPLAIQQCYADYYQSSDHVHVAPYHESTAMQRLDATQLAGTDEMRLYVFGNEAQLNLVAVLDNLGKGASGACVQALDLMLKR